MNILKSLIIIPSCFLIATIIFLIMLLIFVIGLIPAFFAAMFYSITDFFTVLLQILQKFIDILVKTATSHTKTITNG